jgi:MATE family multidrug resistance protein
LSEYRLPRDRDIWRIAAPMILSNVTVPLLGMVDTGVVGHLDDPAYLGAVAIGGTIFGFLYTGVNFLRMGTTGIAAQRVGAGDNDGLRISLGQAHVVALLIALTLIALQAPIGRAAIGLIGGGPAVQDAAREYFSIRIWSAPGTLANFVMIGWFLGLQNARVPLFIFLTINITNIVLDLVFVVGLGMNVGGVALASVIAEYAALLLASILAAKELGRREGSWPLARLFRIRAYAAFVSVNANLFVRTLVLMFTFAFVTAQGARLGSLVLAANAVLINLLHITSFALDGFAHAAEALVGKAVGEGRRDAVEQAVRVTLKWSVVFALGFCLAFAVSGPFFIRILTDLPPVRTAAMQYLPWFVAVPIVAVWSYLYDGVYVGATRAREMRNVMVVSTFVVFLPAWYAFRGWGNHGLWLAFHLFLAGRGVGMFLGYRRRVLPAIPNRA